MHAENQMQADDFQALIQRAEREIVAYEDKDIHSKMTEVEGQLELIKFTVDDGRQFEATRDVVISLSNWLKEL
ncbi:hypothetical protein [Pseudovibrio ascidiaceicola]|nr:hypothetical protein [Pseudovibrio ascidiaceicola]